MGNVSFLTKLYGSDRTAVRELERFNEVPEQDWASEYVAQRASIRALEDDIDHVLSDMRSVEEVEDQLVILGIVHKIESDKDVFVSLSLDGQKLYVMMRAYGTYAIRCVEL